MKEPIYIWGVTIPAKIENKLYQACILNGIDIYNDNIVWFDTYQWMYKLDERPSLYASVILTLTDSEMCALYHRLCDLHATYTDFEILDELEEEIDDE